MIRKWWGRIAFSSFLIIFGIVMIALFTWVDFLGFSVLLGISLLAGGVCLLAFGLKRKVWGRFRMLLMAEGVISMIIGLLLWNTTEGLRVVAMIAWAFSSAALSLLGWRLLSRDGGQWGPLAGKMMLLSSLCYLAFAAALLLIPTYDLTNSFEGFHDNISVLSSLLILIGTVTSLVAIERVDLAEYPKMQDRRWKFGTVLLFSGIFLLLLGVFAYNYKDLVETYDPELGIVNMLIGGRPYQGYAILLLGAGVVLALLGGLLMIVSRKDHHAKWRKRTVAIGVIAILLVQVTAAMLLVNPATFNNDSGRWDLKVGDFYDYHGTSTYYVQHRNASNGELINYTKEYWNMTYRTTITDIAGRDDFYLAGDLHFDGGAPIRLLGKMPKSQTLIGYSERQMELEFVRNESVWTPWGPRTCERYLAHGYAGGGGTYTCDRWQKDGIVLLEIVNTLSSVGYGEAQQWTIRNDVSTLVDTSLEEITQGSGDPIGPPQGDWAPQVGDFLNYSCSGGEVGQGQLAEWRYQVKDVTGPSMLLNLTIFAQDDLGTPLVSGEVARPTNQTAMGVAFYPGSSEGDFTLILVGNETLATPWGALACNHYHVTHIMDNASSYSCEDLYVRNGVLVRMEGRGTGFSMELTGTNLLELAGG